MSSKYNQCAFCSRPLYSGQPHFHASNGVTYCEGDRFIVNGGGIHHGHEVIVVDPQTEYDKAKKTGKILAGNTTIKRPGLIAAFDPKYPETLWWWFAPHQLKNA